MKSLWILTLLFIANLGLMAQDNILASATVLNEATISWNETLIDLGTLERGTTTKTEFTFTNQGSEALLIEKVKTSCGCTASDYPKQPILPGESASVSVSYKAGNSGNFNKSITVYSNTKEAISHLRIKGSVQ